MEYLGKAKIIIEWEITRDIQVETLKIEQKGYIQDLLKAEEMSLCHPTVFLIKAGSTFTLDQVGDFFLMDIIV